MKPITGLKGELEYFFTGGNIDGYHFNRDGYAIGYAPVAGMPPSIGPGGAFKLGAEFSKLASGLTGSSVKQGVKYVDSGGNRVIQIYKNLRANGWVLQSGASSGGIKTLVNPKTGEKIMFRQSKSGGYKGFDTIFQPVSGGRNATIFFN